MTEDQQIREYIRACEHMLAFFKSALNRKGKAAASQSGQDALTELTELRMLAKSDKWSPAYEAGQSEEARALNFLGSVSMPLREKNVLDFGSCEWAVSRILKSYMRSKQVVSYDLNLCKSGMLSDPGVVSTDNLKVVQQMGPYDAILVNDVLDHMENTSYWLRMLRSLVKDKTGRVFVRCHPFTSRNGAHIGEQLNRSHLHLVFTEDELSTFGISCRYTQKIFDAQKTYRIFFEDAGFKIVREKEHRHPVNLEIMGDKRIADRIKRTIGCDDKVVDIIEIDHIDYELSA